MAVQENEKKSYYAIIPADVRYDERLKPNAKLLYGEITALCNERGYCYISTDYFSNLYNLTIGTVSKLIHQLQKCGYIKILPKENIVSIIKSKQFNGFGFGQQICEWCGCKTAVLHRHHYPIPKSKGGKKIVNICPNCHHEFHYTIGVEVINKDDAKMAIEFNNDKC